MSVDAINVQNALKYFGSKKDPIVVLNHLNMSVAKGSIYGLMGASGCGKTTLLSCILGMMPLDEGEIVLLGQKLRSKDIYRSIGFMPQEIALTGDLTVKETLYFFGSIFQMNKKILSQRYELLHNLLELPHANQLIEKCSGGQQRRISFAAAFIHEPELLLLDEPTVGLDPVLREKIWDFMLDATRTGNVSIIITTHYIEEARHADRCGLMRNGILLAEDSPKMIVEKLECENLEEAFLRLCTKQGSIDNGEKMSLTIIDDNNNSDNKSNISDDSEESDVFKDSSSTSHSHRFYNWKIMKALMTKNFLQVRRQPSGLIFLMLVPLASVLLYHFAIGGNPIGLKIGIVNEEVPNFEDCANSTALAVIPRVGKKDCKLKNLSCRYLNQIPDEVGTNIFYSSLDEAFRDEKQGLIHAVIHFNANFSESVENALRKKYLVSKKDWNNRMISIYIDNYIPHILYFIRWRLQVTYDNYTKKLMQDCGYPQKLEILPIDFKLPIYGNQEIGEKMTMGASLMMLVLFYISSAMTLTSLATERRDGFWNRQLLSGCKMKEVVTSHLLVQSVLVAMLVIESFFLLYYVFEFHRNGGIAESVAIAILCGQIGIVGMLFGMCLSCYCENPVVSACSLVGTSIPIVFLSGIFSPIQRIPFFLRIFTYASPFTVPALIVKDIVIRKYGFFDKPIYLSFVVVFLWTIVFTFTLFKIMHRRKFRR